MCILYSSLRCISAKKLPDFVGNMKDEYETEKNYSKSHERTSYCNYDLKEGTSKENVNAASVLIFMVTQTS